MQQPPCLFGTNLTQRNPDLFLAAWASGGIERQGLQKKNSPEGLQPKPTTNKSLLPHLATRNRSKIKVEEAERLRIRIKKMFGNIRRLCFDGAMEAAEEVLPNRRPSTIQSFERLKQVAEALEVVWEDFSSQIGRDEKSHQCDISPALNTNKENINKIFRVKNGMTRRGVKKAIVAIARKLAVIMTRIWRDGTTFA